MRRVAAALAAILVVAACATHKPVRDEIWTLRYERDPVKADAKAEHKAERIEIRQYRSSVAAAALSAFSEGMAQGSQAQSQPQSAAPQTATTLRLHARGDDDARTFLGCLSCGKYEKDSVFFEYGEYGSEHSATSIRNPYSIFGSPYSATSACNPYATNPPFIFDDAGDYYGKLTVNEFATDANLSETMQRIVKTLCAH